MVEPPERTEGREGSMWVRSIGASSMVVIFPCEERCNTSFGVVFRHLVMAGHYSVRVGESVSRGGEFEPGL